MQPRIKNIISISSFSIVCEWTNGEIRNINFYDLKETFHSNMMEKILLPDVFNTVKIDAIAKTLSWENQLPFIDYDGQEKMGALDFCPDVLYRNSTLVLAK